MENNKYTIRKIAVFLSLTLGLSSVFYFLIISNGSLNAAGGLYVMGLMWCPGIAALITQLVFEKSLAGLGWKWGSTYHQLSAYFLPVLYAFIAYSVIWVSGLGRFNHFFPSGPFNFVLVGTLSSAFMAMGEEIGWRGFLVPHLSKITGFTRVSLISGLIWSVWHYPVLLFADYNSGTPWWYGLTCFTLLAIGASFIFAWFRLKSGSLWTAVFLHASHNLYIQSYFDKATDDTGFTAYFSGEFGIVLPVVIAGFAYYFWKKRKSLVRDQLVEG
jgi:membrane protease YdiL (CAAX protease family)